MNKHKLFFLLLLKRFGNIMRELYFPPLEKASGILAQIFNLKQQSLLLLRRDAGVNSNFHIS